MDESDLPSLNFSKEYREGHKVGNVVTVAEVDETGVVEDFSSKELTVPTKVSELENDSGYLTEHQSLVDYAKKTEVPTKVSQLENDSNFVTKDFGITGATDHDSIRIKTVDETGRPTSLEAYDFDDAVTSHNEHFGVLTGFDLPWSNFSKDHREGHKVGNVVTVAEVDEDGIVTDFSSKELTVPAKVSQLENDSGYLTEHQSLTEYAKKSEIPTVPTKVSELQNDSGYLTEHQSLVDYAKKSEIPTVPTKVSELQNDSGYLTEHQSLVDYAKKSEIPTVPTKVSELQNDSGYLTEHQSLVDYAKKTEVFESLAEYAKKSEVPTIPESLKNPNALTIKVGDTTTTYDGSEAKTVDISAGESIPSYWLTHLQTKADEIHQAMELAGRNKSAFLFYTDAHWDYGAKKAPMLLKYLYNNTPINKTIFGGDIVNSESTDRDVMKYLWEWRKQVRELPNHHSVVGNHDDGAATNNLFSTDYIYSFLLAAEETPNIVQGGDMYYYIDEPCEKTRYLYLDTAYIGINSSQTTFIKEALKTAPDNWHIVAISHIWYEPDYNQYSVRPIPIVGYGTGVESIVNLFDNYNARQDEFSNCTAKVEFCIGGHCHRDYTGRTTGGIPIILCETDSHHNRSGLTDTAGTTTESAVSAIIVNYSTEKINVIRIGRGENFEVPLRASVTPPASYTNLIPTAIDTSGNVYNNSGYKAGTFISNSDGVTETANPTYWCTGLIPITKGDVVRIKYVFDKSTYDDSANHYYSHLCFYNADKSFNRFKYLNDFLNNFISGSYEWSGTNFEGTLTFTFDGSSSMFNNAKYIRVSSAYLGSSENVQTSIENAVITINEEIS